MNWKHNNNKQSITKWWISYGIKCIYQFPTCKIFSNRSTHTHTFIYIYIYVYIYGLFTEESIIKGTKGKQGKHIDIFTFITVPSISIDLLINDGFGQIFMVACCVVHLYKLCYLLLVIINITQLGQYNQLGRVVTTDTVVTRCIHINSTVYPEVIRLWCYKIMKMSGSCYIGPEIDYCYDTIMSSIV